MSLVFHHVSLCFPPLFNINSNLILKRDYSIQGLLFGTVIFSVKNYFATVCLVKRTF